MFFCNSLCFLPKKNEIGLNFPSFSYTLIILYPFSKYYENARTNSFSILFYCLHGLHLLIFLRHTLSAFLLLAIMTSGLISMCFSEKSNAESILAKEYFLKAAFLYNFARLVDWPKEAFKSNSDPINLCLIGEDHFDNALRTIQNKKIQKRRLVIQRFIKLSDVSYCHILFISHSELNRISEILAATRTYPILTVSEIPDFAEQNGHIRLFLSDEEKLNLEVNLDSIKQSKLTISSRILTLATIISSKEILKGKGNP